MESVPDAKLSYQVVVNVRTGRFSISTLLQVTTSLMRNNSFIGNSDYPGG